MAEYKIKNIFQDKELKAQIKEQILILDIAKEYGLTLIPKGGYYSLKEHDSVIIYPATNSFYRNATDVGGDVLKFMEHMPEIDIKYAEAYRMLAKRIDPSIKVGTVIKEKPQVKINRINMTLTERQERTEELLKQVNFDVNNKNVMAYLIQTRKLDPNLVFDMIRKGYIKQDIDHLGNRSACFMGHDDTGLVSAITKRACNGKSNFKMELKGCDYNFGWLYDPEVDARKLVDGKVKYNPDKPLLAFESYIDMMSYMTIQKMQGKDINRFAYISCGSANKYKSVLTTQEHYGYKSVLIGFDNDEAGRMYAGKLGEKLKERNVKGAYQFAPLYEQKDWNDALKFHVEKKNLV